MMTTATALDGLKRRRPEWGPWLAVIEEMLGETGTRRWDATVPDGTHERQATPLLAGAVVSIDAGSVRRLLKRLIRVAANGRTAKMGTLEAGLDPDLGLDVLTLFRASLCQDGDAVKQVAAMYGADAEALQAVVALVAVPFLQACNRHWASAIPESWVEGYCPVCGSWPAFAEVRGIERSRYFRCGRCGGEWHAEGLCCPYCDMRDHNELLTLVPKDSHATIEGCRRCLGYIKTFTRLQACPPSTVMLEDLASVDLDIAALDAGFSRPPGAGCALGVTVAARSGMRRFFPWNA
jgi:FdhE protein